MHNSSKDYCYLIEASQSTLVCFCLVIDVAFEKRHLKNAQQSTCTLLLIIVTTELF